MRRGETLSFGGDRFRDRVGWLAWAAPGLEEQAKGQQNAAALIRRLQARSLPQAHDSATAFGTYPPLMQPLAHRPRQSRAPR